MKNFLRDEKHFYQKCKESGSSLSYTCSISNETGLIAPAPLPKQEFEVEESIPMSKLDTTYSELFRSFQTYFASEAKSLEDSTLNNELKLIEDLLSCKSEKSSFSRGSTKEVDKMDLQTHNQLVAEKVKALEASFKSSFKFLPNSVDVCFLMDCTGSMGSWIDMCKNKIEEIVDLITKTYSASTQLRLSFVGYRDIKDTPRFSIHPFTTNPSALKTFIQREAVASGGGDFPEDIAGGLKKTLELDWYVSCFLKR